MFVTIDFDGSNLRTLMKQVQSELDGGSRVITIDMSRAVEPPMMMLLVKLNSRFGGGRGSVYSGKNKWQIVVDATNTGSDSENDGCRPCSGYVSEEERGEFVLLN
jgi:hypothetical protein